MSSPIHPDDMPSPRFGGWADDFNTYREACEYYGVDTPEQVAAEFEYYDQQEMIAGQDAIECNCGPKYNRWAGYAPFDDMLDDMPF